MTRYGLSASDTCRSGGGFRYSTWPEWVGEKVAAVSIKDRETHIDEYARRCAGRGDDSSTKKSSKGLACEWAVCAKGSERTLPATQQYEMSHVSLIARTVPTSSQRTYTEDAMQTSPGTFFQLRTLFH